MQSVIGSYSFGVLFCLFPLMVYCLFMAGLNQRRQATVLSGTWDFAGVLLALAGFLLWGGPKFLQQLEVNVFGLGRALGVSGMLPVLWVLYGLFVLGGAGLLLWQRHWATAIYNVDPSFVEDMLPRICEQLGFVSTQRGRVLRIEDYRRDDGHSPVSATVRLEPNAMFWHATLIWSGSADIRHEVETAIDRELSSIAVDANPLAGWLISAMCFCFVLFLMALVTIFVQLGTRG